MHPSKRRDVGEMKHLSDQELMRIVQAGDQSPASELYDRYSGKIYNFSYRFVRNAEVAEDATQETFIRMLKHAQSYNGKASLSTWLFSIAANWCRDYLRRAENRVPKESDEVLVSLPGPADLSPHRTLEQREAGRRIEKAMEVLNQDQREALLLEKFQGMSYAEIAKIAGCSEGAVKTRVFRAMELLKQTLAGEASGGDRCLNAVQ